MRTSRLMAMALLFALLPLTSTAQSSDQNQKLAQNLVTNVLHAKTGDVVVINADSSHMPLVEELVVSLRSIGAYGIPVVGSNRINKMYYQRVPEKYDTQPPADALRLESIANSMIFVDYPFDPSVTQGVPASRLSALNDAGVPATVYPLKHNIPLISIGNGILPSAATAANYGVPESTLSNLFWSGVNADYAQIHADAQAMKEAVSAAHSVHITAANGTNFTVRALPGSVVMNDGTISAENKRQGGAALQKQLPAGDVYFRPEPGSANGTIVFWDSARYNGTAVRRLTVHFSNGVMTSMSAASGGKAVADLYAAGTSGRNRLAFFDFGVNRAMHVGPGDWGPGPSMAAGYVTAGIGNDLGFGGSNRSTFQFSSGIPNATVTVDGKTIISNGRLVLH